MKPTRAERAFEAIVGLYPCLIVALGILMTVRRVLAGSFPWIGLFVIVCGLLILRGNYRAWQRWKRRVAAPRLGRTAYWDSDVLGPDDPMFNLMMGTGEHGALIVETVDEGDGPRIYRARYQDGTEIIGDPPVHEEER